MQRRWLVVTTSVLAAVMLATLVAAGATAGPRNRLTARLTGDAEVPGPGAPNGVGTALIRANREAKRVCFAITWRRIGRVTGAHIHTGRADVAGDVVVALFAADSGLSRGVRAVAGCVRGVGGRLIADIKRHPRRYYVNVHTLGLPAGAIRGQLN